MSNLHYPNLAPCRVVVNGASGSTKPPVRLPAACLAAAREPEVSSPYDFALEHTILDSVDDRRRLATASSEEEIKKTVLAKMQSLTNANEHVCVELLESNKYDLHTSVEAYFAK